MGGGGDRGGGQDGCERRIEVFVKIQKKDFGGWGSGWGGGGGGQGGCERRIEVFVKIQKKNWGEVRGVGRGGVGLGGGGGGGGRVGVFRVDVNEELKFCGKFTKKKFGGGESGGRG